MEATKSPPAPQKTDQSLIPSDASSQIKFCATKRELHNTTCCQNKKTPDEMRDDGGVISDELRDRLCLNNKSVNGLVVNGHNMKDLASPNNCSSSSSCNTSKEEETSCVVESSSSSSSHSSTSNGGGGHHTINNNSVVAVVDSISSEESSGYSSSHEESRLCKNNALDVVQRPSSSSFCSSSSASLVVADRHPPSSATPDYGSDIHYVSYESELQMPDIMRLIQKDLSEPYSIYTYRYFIHNWPKLCFLAMCGEECVGAIVCKLDLHRKVMRRGYIAMLAVDEKHRKKRIGSNLVLKAIRAMVADQADEVVLETEITNQPALRLYENLGFVRDKRLFRYYLNGVDALRLKLWLR